MYLKDRLASSSSCASNCCARRSWTRASMRLSFLLLRHLRCLPWLRVVEQAFVGLDGDARCVQVLDQRVEDPTCSFACTAIPETRNRLVAPIDRKSTRLNSSHTDISRMP